MKKKKLMVMMGLVQHGDVVQEGSQLFYTQHRSPSPPFRLHLHSSLEFLFFHGCFLQTTESFIIVSALPGVVGTTNHHLELCSLKKQGTSTPSTHTQPCLWPSISTKGRPATHLIRIPSAGSRPVLGKNIFFPGHGASCCLDGKVNKGYIRRACSARRFLPCGW